MSSARSFETGTISEEASQASLEDMAGTEEPGRRRRKKRGEKKKKGAALCIRVQVTFPSSSWEMPLRCALRARAWVSMMCG